MLLYQRALKMDILQRAANQLLGRFWDDQVILQEADLSNDWASLSQSLIEGWIILSKTKWISWLVVEQMWPTIYQAITNVDGGSTNKCNKNILSIIITSMLAGLIDAIPSSSSCNSFALCECFFFSYFYQNLQENKVSESVEI